MGPRVKPGGDDCDCGIARVVRKTRDPARAFARRDRCGIIRAIKETHGEDVMRRICSRIALVVFAAAVPAFIATFAAAQGAPDLRKPAGKDWPSIGGDWSNSRYSTLTQINRNNVKNLKAAWAVHLGSGLGPKYSLEGTPVVKDGVLYISSGND